jgi:DNA-directed RNA polymerase specialized sigma24 family protein
MSRFVRAGIRLEGERTPFELAESCHALSGTEGTDSVVRGLARIAGADELAGLTALVALRPVLLKLARRQQRGGASREEAEVEVLYAAWETIIEPGPRAVGEDFVGQIRNGIGAKSRTRLRRRWRAERLESPRANLPDRGANGSEPERCVFTLLSDALRSGALSREQAVLLAETKGEDMSVREVAALRGSSPATVRNRRRRAERALLAYVSESDQELLGG